MALADRTYMREDQHPVRYTTILIVVLIVAFFVQCILELYGRVDLVQWLGLSVAGLKALRLWQLITFQFLHAAPWPWHVLFNCLGLYFFGRTVEETLGPRRFLIL